jgi:hypothetical protein
MARAAQPLAAQWLERLRPELAGYARLALENIAREFPSNLLVRMNEPGDFPHRPRDRTPVFYGSFDWHSCVEMHWVLIRLLKLAPGAVPAAEIRAALDAQLTAQGLRREAEFITRDGRSERPYGWSWALSLIHELADWPGDADARRWAESMTPLAEALTSSFLEWLPKETYPVRTGLHPNSAFGLSRALPFARMQAGLGQPALAAAIEAAAARWYLPDIDYPGGWEPSGHDFLSPALTEAELMARLLAPEGFAPWLESFLPGLAAGEPAALFSPVVVSDSSDGQIAHLHGLNLSRAWCYRRLAETLPADDQRAGPCAEAMQRHAEASLPHVVGDDYMVSHWLAAYAVLLFS